MFCYQCEQTARGTGCTTAGVCGKDAATATLQDLLIHAAKGIAMWGHRAAALGAANGRVDRFVTEALFTTVTNVNFDADRLEGRIRDGAVVLARAREMYEGACKEQGVKPETPGGPAAFVPAADRAGLLAQGVEAGIAAMRAERGDDAAGLTNLITFGLKGTAAYADHALILGQSDPAVFAFFHEALDFLTRENTVADLTAMALRVGEVNLRAMELLDAGNTGTYGHPEPTRVWVTPRKGKAILISGHDLKDLGALLEQTAGKGIDVYTHGEMLPCHGYPGLKKHAHLAGNYGGAWQDQRREFDAFPGAVLMTTNCIQRPKETYQARIFTTGLVAWPGVTHVTRDDFGPVIAAALDAPGFTADVPEQSITVGFGRNAVLGVADKVIEAVKQKKIRHFFLVGGCDGAKSGRNYYTDFAKAVPDDCVILTLACGKYRFNKLEFGDIGGIPRLLDIGQCNDSYSAIRIAQALASAFDTDVNSLPLSIILSWYEQKAVCVLLSLLHLGIRDIRLGPSLPAFVTPPVLNVLVETFGLKPITTPEQDLAAILG
ncbi:MAG TPA: hydroxylamine reductase [Polyangia bacterium]|nr:hydroxylamine reductase [Polyangia bacterium]